MPRADKITDLPLKIAPMGKVLVENTEKKYGWKDLIATAKMFESKGHGKTEKIDHDLIIYGVSRKSKGKHGGKNG